MKTTTTIRIDEALLKNLQGFAKSLGISFTTLATAAFQKVLQDRKVELSLPVYHLNEKYEEELLNDPDMYETAFVAKTPEESRAFLTSLMKK